jgi:hypothetical protein
MSHRHASYSIFKERQRNPSPDPPGGDNTPSLLERLIAPERGFWAGSPTFSWLGRPSGGPCPISYYTTAWRGCQRPPRTHGPSALSFAAQDGIDHRATAGGHEEPHIYHNPYPMSSKKFRRQRPPLFPAQIYWTGRFLRGILISQETRLNWSSFRPEHGARGGKGMSHSVRERGTR